MLEFVKLALVGVMHEDDKEEAVEASANQTSASVPTTSIEVFQQAVQQTQNENTQINVPILIHVTFCTIE